MQKKHIESVQMAYISADGVLSTTFFIKNCSLFIFPIHIFKINLLYWVHHVFWHEINAAFILLRRCRTKWHEVSYKIILVILLYIFWQSFLTNFEVFPLFIFSACSKTAESLLTKLFLKCIILSISIIMNYSFAF